MSRSKARGGSPSKQKIRRIKPPGAETVVDKCRQTLAELSNLLEKLATTGIGELLSTLDERVLQLALQPDSWGQRIKAILISEIAPALCGGSRAATGTEDLVKVSKVVMLCLLLEIGRRKQYIQVEFAANPTGPGPCVKLRIGASSPVHSLNIDEMIQLTAAADEALVGLCYFGDAKSCAAVESALTFADAPKSRSCRTHPAQKSEN